MWLWCCQIDQISIEELDIISQLPHCVPISAGHNWNMDELIDKVRGCKCSGQNRKEHVDRVQVHTTTDVIESRQALGLSVHCLCTHNAPAHCVSRPFAPGSVFPCVVLFPCRVRCGMTAR